MREASTRRSRGENLSTIPSRVQIKLNQASELYPKIVSSCVRYLELPSSQILEEIGSYIGSMVNNLRSALNYAMQDFCEGHLRNILSPRDYKSLNRDFPYGKSKAEFERKRIIEPIANHFKDIYNFIERIQPYHNKNAWLWYLMRISNIDKHITINEVATPMPTCVALRDSKFRAKIFGDKVMVSHSDGSVSVHTTPCFIEPYQMFASSGGKWILFLISIDNQNLGLMRFVTDVNHGVSRLISEFYDLL